jgi:hypothetical protein
VAGQANYLDDLPQVGTNDVMLVLFKDGNPCLSEPFYAFRGDQTPKL